MKTLVIVSDTHGKKKGLDEICGLFAENDYILHLGDGEGDMRTYSQDDFDKLYRCSGNCDLFSYQPTEGVLEVEGVRIFYCHGHKYGVKRDLYELAQAAKSRDCQVALYGHTHRALISNVDGVILINPGTLQYSLDKGGSYCYLVIHKKEITPTIVGNVAMAYSRGF